MPEAKDHLAKGQCWCGQYHAMMVEIHPPAPDWAPTTSDDLDEDAFDERID